MKYIKVQDLNILGVDVFNGISTIILGDSNRDMLIKVKNKIKIQHGSTISTLFDASDPYVKNSELKNLVEDIIKDIK